MFLICLVIINYDIRQIYSNLHFVRHLLSLHSKYLNILKVEMQEFILKKIN